MNGLRSGTPSQQGPGHKFSVERIQQRVRSNLLGIRHLIETLDLGISELEDTGWFSENTKRRLKAEYVGSEQSLGIRK